MKGKPHKAKLANVIQALAVGIWNSKLPIHRKSWVWRCSLINAPAQINNNALNSACVSIWKYAKLGAFRPILVIIIPSWLNVDRAIIFFMSHSIVALKPAINIVETAINRIIELK